MIRASQHRGGHPRGVRRGPGDPMHSNYFDLGMILDYWGPKRLNHHTEATSMLYAARECARILVEEGLEAVIDRHSGPAPRCSPGSGPGAGGVRRRGAQDEQRRRGRHPRRRRRRRRARRAAAGLRHRDRDLLRPAGRPGLADRHDGLQRPPRHRADDARRARAGAAPGRCEGHPRRRRRRGVLDAGQRPEARRLTTARPAASWRAATSSPRTARADGIERVYLSPEHRAVNRPRRPAGCTRPDWDVAGRRRQPVRSSRRGDPEAPALLLGLAPRHRARRRALRRHPRGARRDRGRPRARRTPDASRSPSRWSRSATRRAPASARAAGQPRARRHLGPGVVGPDGRAGITLRDGVRRVRTRPGALRRRRPHRGDFVGYLEAHIEQGPELDDGDARSASSRRSPSAAVRAARGEARHAADARASGATTPSSAPARASSRSSG